MTTTKISMPQWAERWLRAMRHWARMLPSSTRALRRMDGSASSKLMLPMPRSSIPSLTKLRIFLFSFYFSILSILFIYLFNFNLILFYSMPFYFILFHFSILLYNIILFIIHIIIIFYSIKYIIHWYQWSLKFIL